MNTNSTPFPDADALMATVARLFALEGNLLAVDLLSTAKPRFEWYSHDNWDGGFDIYDVYLEVPLNLYSKIGHGKQTLEKSVLEKVQSVSQGHTVDHIREVTIVLEVTGGKDWRKKAKAWVAGDEKISPTDSTAPNETELSIRPEIFTIPVGGINENQVAVMMPFAAEFNDTYGAIKSACKAVGLQAVRADDIWSNSTFIQDIFQLIYCSRIVIVDFSTRNPNVMYETGIAHTLGRHVVPITRRIEDVPSDLQHHRALVYLSNQEGLDSLSKGLTVRLSTVTGREPRTVGV